MPKYPIKISIEYGEFNPEPSELPNEINIYGHSYLIAVQDYEKKSGHLSAAYHDKQEANILGYLVWIQMILSMVISVTSNEPVFKGIAEGINEYLTKWLDRYFKNLDETKRYGKPGSYGFSDDKSVPPTD